MRHSLFTPPLHHRSAGPDFGHGAPRGMHRHGGGRGRRRMFEANELRLILLKLISGEPRHGYDLIREIETLSGGAYVPSPGVIYPTLTLLADMDLASEHPDEGGNRKLFAMTEAGQTYLSEHAEEADAAFARLEALAKVGQRTHGAPIRRAMENLKMALRNRLEKEGADKDTMFDVAALIDEAARKIERL